MNTLEKISHLLHQQKKKQKDLTDYLGLTKNTFTNWKLGASESYKKHIDKIAEFFDVSTDYLLGIEKKPLINEDEELTEYLQELKSRDEMRMLFSITKDCTKEEVEQAVRIIEALRKGN